MGSKESYETIQRDWILEEITKLSVPYETLCPASRPGHTIGSGLKGDIKLPEAVIKSLEKESYVWDGSSYVKLTE